MQKRNNNPVVYIVILNYKNWHDTVDCLESVFRSTYENFRVFVIDNDSQNESLQHLMTWAAAHLPGYSDSTHNFYRNRDLDQIMGPASLPKLVFVQNENNTGFAGGNNIILRILADQDAYVWMLNPDMVVADNALSELVQFAQTQPPGSIIGSVIKFHDCPQKVHMYGGARINFRSATISLITEPDEIGNLDYISGGSLFTSTRQLKEFGLLPENYFLYWEETDWCYSARLRGGSLAVCLSSVIYDKVGTTIGRSFLAEYYFTRNGLLFLYKYKRENVRLALFFCIIRLIKKIMTGQWKRAKGVYIGAESFMKMISHGNK